MADSRFAGKFISRLEKIDREQIESYLLKLWRERSFLERVFITLQEGIIITDIDSRIIYINRAGYKLLGISQRRHLLGEPLVKVVTDSELLEQIRNFTLSLNGQAKQYEIKVRFPRNATYLLKILPLRDESDQSISSLIFIINDITDTKLQEQEKFRQERLGSLATLTAGIAHEIKNPLNALNIHAQLIKRALDTNETLTKDSEEFARIKESTEIILEEIRRLTRMVNQFISAVRPLKLQLQPCNINQVIEDLIETIKVELQEKHIQLSLLLDPEVPPVYADEYLVRQALLNIMKNAIEAIEHQQGEIEIKTYAADNWVYVSVSDNGKGMNEEELRQMFEPYFTTKTYGSGLGLFIVYRVIQEHRGEIQVNSTPGKGTTFIVQLPVVKRPVRLLTHKTAK